MNIMKRILYALSMVVPCLLLAGVQEVVAQPVAGQPVIVQPAGTVTWAQMQAVDAQIPALLKVPQVAVPFMPTPPPPTITGYPATLPVAPARQSSQVLFPGPLSVADQTAAPAPVGGVAALVPALGASFQGLGDNNTTIPPDTMGAVGPNHVMTMLNSQVRIQNRTGGIISTVSLATFWASVGALVTPFDPHVVYDTLSNRWIATIDSNPASAGSRLHLAVSTTSDPTAAWTFYSFTADATGVTWADYPGLGINSKWIVITNNMFNVTGNTFAGAKMWVLNKAQAMAGGVLSATIMPTGFSGGSSLQPAVTFDAAEPNMYIVDNGWSSGAGAIDYFHLSRITGTVNAPVWSLVPDAAGPFPGNGLVDAVQRFNRTLVGAAQLGSVNLISTNDIRVINAVFRNGHLWFAHSGGFPNEPAVATRTDMFWYEVDPRLLNTTGAALVQSGTGVASLTANAALTFPTVAVNKFNDAAFGMTELTGAQYATALVFGRKSTDPAGLTWWGPGGFIFHPKAGLAPYFKTFGGTRNRWGDYSATMADPRNNGDFWTIQEYAELPVGLGVNKDRWGTWWAQVKMGRATVPNDFNGDGKSDLLWHNIASGANTVWLMNGLAVGAGSGASQGLPDVNWRIAGIGDFSGDGKADILWRHGVTGGNALWTMNGKTRLSAAAVRGVGVGNWAIAGTGDFNGDGKADILWRNAVTGGNVVWLMNGSTVLTAAPTSGVSGGNWKVGGIGDFNGDAKSDILWHNIASGANTVWLMNGTAVGAGSGASQGLPTVSWKIAGVGDFNADGKADILWRNSVSGGNALWTMNGKARLSAVAVRGVGVGNWGIAKLGDYNGDGKLDILWRNAASGGNVIWLMNGSVVVTAAPTSGVSGTNWQVN